MKTLTNMTQIKLDSQFCGMTSDWLYQYRFPEDVPCSACRLPPLQLGQKHEKRGQCENKRATGAELALTFRIA